MDNAFIQEMKTALEQEQANLKKDLDAISRPDTGDHVPGDRDPKQPDYGDDALDENTNSPQESAQYAQNVDATGILSERLAQVEAALERIEKGAYGTDSNGNAIGEDRLRANPAATE